MPRVEDIAWKFVVRLEGKRWRCPYCHKISAGSVTRVKSHFHKQAKVGIASCTKVPEHIRTLMELFHNHQGLNKEDVAWKFVDRLGDNKWRCHHCRGEFFGDLTGVKGHLLGVPTEWISICTEVPDHIRTLMRSLLDEVAEEESREANGQSSPEPQSHDMPLDNLDASQQRDLSDSLPETPVEYIDVNTSKEIQTNELHNPTVGSSLQNDLSLDVDHTNRLLDCSQPCAVEGVRLFSNTSPTNSVQHPDQLQSRCDKKDGNDTRSFPPPTPMDIDPIASRHTIDSRVIEATIVDLQVPVLATNTTGPSSSKDMNRCSPTKNLRSIYANDERIRKLKIKMEELDDKEAFIKEQMEIESAASSIQKKPRRLVERWLKETERARNNFQLIGQANAETLPPKEQVETLMREVEELIEKTLPQTLLIEERDAKVVKFLEPKLTGEAIYRNIEFIWDHLTKNHACRLGIYGMGGVGKTTIMMRIHNRLLEDASFDGVIFITVSQDSSIYKLQSDIWKALKLGVMEDGHENKRAAMLSKQLERKKNCVLILDDVWERLDLEEVGVPVRADGLKLVLTTRSFDVCRQMQCKKTIKINPLSQEEAECLFSEELGSDVALNLEIEAVVKSIVRECAGLPIGVIMMARSMRGVTNVFEWRDSLVKLKESSMGQTDMEKVLMNLKFSYDRLRNPSVQQCFLSCALYPEDEFIDKFEIVEFFIDQGLIVGLNTRKEQYDRGLTILNMLANVCLLEYQGSEMKMHNMVRDMALHIMGATSIVKAGKQLMRIPPEEYWTDALEKVSLMKNNIREFPLNMSPNCPKLSTLMLAYGLSCDAVIPNSFFKKLWGLEVLNLSGYDMTELPDSFSNLVNLRALLLRECRKLRCIPYLGKLTSLRKLDARGCVSLEAIEGLEKLVNLRYLDLTETGIERLPKGTLDRLPNLQCLKIWAVNEGGIKKLGALETLICYFENADAFNKCVRAIEQSNYIHCYVLSLDLEGLFLMEAGGDVRFEKLGRIVYISGWGHAIVSMGVECTSFFILVPRDVQKLAMTKCDGITNLSGVGLLKHLEELDIGEWENLRVLCGGEDKEVIDIHDSPAPTPTPPPPPPPSPFLFRNLRLLEIFRCPKLKYLFGHGFNLPFLRKIEMWDCQEMVGIIAAVTSPPRHPSQAFPCLEEIIVRGCDKMKRAVESKWMPHFPNLRSIVVYDCENMEEIIEGVPPYVLVEEISLESLDISGCDNLRKLFSHEWLLHLRNLQHINVSGCKGMVEMISGAGQGQEGSIVTPVNSTPPSFRPSSISLPKLKQLYLYDLPQLKSICEVPISCDSMEDLNVYGCPELKNIPLQLRLRETEELPHIWVEDEEKWKTLRWDHPDAQAILQPFLQKGEHANEGVLSFWPRFGCPCYIELSTKGKDLV